MSEQSGTPNRGTTAISRPELRLRPERPPVTRLSRKVLMGLAAVAAIVVSGALIWALYQGRGKRAGSGELYNTENKPTPDGLAEAAARLHGRAANSLPPTGSGCRRSVLRCPAISAGRCSMPQVPGTGRASRRSPSSSASRRKPRRRAPAVCSPRPTPGSDPRRRSRRRRHAGQGVATQVGLVETPPLDPDSLLNMQDRKLAFLNGAVDRKTVSPDRLANPASRYVVQAGAVIPAALITGIRSDLPGQVTAQVTENVYDSPTGRYLLIPQGSKLIGLYDSQISFGQDRVLLVWTRLIMPNGRSIVLERQPGADTQGFAGLEDEVDQHWGRLFMAAALSTLLGVGSELGATNNDNSIVAALQARQQRQPQSDRPAGRTPQPQHPADAHDPPGFPVRVIVNRDLVFR